jgi:hypothetical protein
MIMGLLYKAHTLLYKVLETIGTIIFSLIIMLYPLFVVSLFVEYGVIFFVIANIVTIYVYRKVFGEGSPTSGNWFTAMLYFWLIESLGLVGAISRML